MVGSDLLPYRVPVVDEQTSECSRLPPVACLRMVVSTMMGRVDGHAVTEAFTVHGSAVISGHDPRWMRAICRARNTGRVLARPVLARLGLVVVQVFEASVAGNGHSVRRCICVRSRPGAWLSADPIEQRPACLHADVFDRASPLGCANHVSLHDQQSSSLVRHHLSASGTWTGTDGAGSYATRWRIGRSWSTPLLLVEALRACCG